MSRKVSEIYAFIDKTAPFSSQEEWDNSGLLIGNPDKEVERVLLCLDVSSALIDKAEKRGAGLIISHHPLIFEPLRSLDFDSPAALAVGKGICVISAHTNWDAAEGGVSDVLGRLLGLSNLRPLYDSGEGAALRIGELKEARRAADFAAEAAKKLKGSVRLSLPEKKIKSVAVCGGGGSSLLPLLKGKGADAFFTGEAKQNFLVESVECGISLMAGGHYETEAPAMRELQLILEEEFPNMKFEYAGEPPAVCVG